MNNSTTVRRLSRMALAVTAVAGIGLASAPSASALTKDGALEAYEFGLYYNSGQLGCVFDLANSDWNFSGDTFWKVSGTCNGIGQSTNDNTASYRNRDNETWWVYTDADGDGAEGTLPAGYAGDASSTFKNEISSAFPYDAH
ncbi:peptidase inhibitor family I36 protein [Streptomyces sp. NPDC006134]|uniref:peptidase inhibitor family I36 protein n=1 Tax=Streptomyces sp. NPDC006134 TaxID=3154467 RepID=UPI0033C5D470